jgi:hypothetical protein
MRRVIAITAGLIVLGSAATVGATQAIGSGGSTRAPVQAPAASDPADIAASLNDPAVRALYDIPSGTLISATACVHGKCSTKRFAADPTCAPTAETCIGSAMVARKLPGGVTISVEVL